MSERWACRVVKQPRGTQRYRPTQRDDEDALTQAIVMLASQYGRYGYRRITALLQHAGWQVGKDRVERIWRREGLKVPKKQKPRGRLWLNDGSCVRLRPERANHVWSYDFVSGRTHDGRRVRMLNLIDEHTRESLLVRPERRWSAAKVIEALADVMVRNFVRVIFLSYPTGSGFAAGDQASTASLSCVLRSGHTVEEKTNLLQQLWAMFQDLSGIATDQLAISLQEIPSSNAMEMGQIMQSVGHE
jgi:hypothetical protein